MWRRTRQNREVFLIMPHSHNLLHIFFKSQAYVPLSEERCMLNLRPKTEILLTVLLSCVLLTYELLVDCPALRAAFLLFSKLHQSVCLKGSSFWFLFLFFAIFSKRKPQEQSSNASLVCYNCISLFILSLGVPLYIAQKGNNTPTLNTTELSGHCSRYDTNLTTAPTIPTYSRTTCEEHV